MRNQEVTGDYDSYYSENDVVPSSPLTYPAQSLSSSSSPKIRYGSSVFKAARAGTGAAFEGRCGEVAKVISCFSNEKHKKGRKNIINNCHRYVCPVCMEQTASRAADEVEERLTNLAALWRQAGRDIREPRHWDFSPDDQAYWSRERIEEDGGKGIWKAFAKALKKAVPYYTLDNKGQRVDMDQYNASTRSEKAEFRRRRGPLKKKPFDYGVVAVFHGEREKFFYGGQWISKADLPKDPLSGQFLVDPTKVPHQWVWGPHFHVIGFGFWINSLSFKSKSGWQYNKIDDTKGERDIRSTVLYQLTHCTVVLHNVIDYHGQEKERQFGQAYHYYGLVSNAKGSFLEEVIEEEEKCEECAKEGVESFMHEFLPIKVDEHWEPDRKTDFGVHIKKRIVRHWYINQGKPKRKVRSDLYRLMERRKNDRSRASEGT